MSRCRQDACTTNAGIADAKRSHGRSSSGDRLMGRAGYARVMAG